MTANYAAQNYLVCLTQTSKTSNCTSSSLPLTTNGMENVLKTTTTTKTEENKNDFSY